MPNDRNGTQDLDSGSFAGESEAQGSTWASIRQFLQIITIFLNILVCFDFLNLHRSGF